MFSCYVLIVLFNIKTAIKDHRTLMKKKLFPFESNYLIKTTQRYLITIYDTSK